MTREAGKVTEGEPNWKSGVLAEVRGGTRRTLVVTAPNFWDPSKKGLMMLVPLGEEVEQAVEMVVDQLKPGMKVEYVEDLGHRTFWPRDPEETGQICIKSFRVASTKS